VGLVHSGTGETHEGQVVTEAADEQAEPDQEVTQHRPPGPGDAERLEVCEDQAGHPPRELPSSVASVIAGPPDMATFFKVEYLLINTTAAITGEQRRCVYGTIALPGPSASGATPRRVTGRQPNTLTRPSPERRTVGPRSIGSWPMRRAADSMCWSAGAWAGSGAT